MACKPFSAVLEFTSRTSEERRSSVSHNFATVGTEVHSLAANKDISCHNSPIVVLVDKLVINDRRYKQLFSAVAKEMTTQETTPSNRGHVLSSTDDNFALGASDVIRHVEGKHVFATDF